MKWWSCAKIFCPIIDPQNTTVQSFTDFYAKLQELAQATNLENMTMQDYIIFRVMVRLNDPKTVDQLLSIPAQDFTIEEVNRVAVACEGAKA